MSFTRERSKELGPILQAFGEGKTIQYRQAGSEKWHTPRKDIDEMGFLDDFEYRIAPEPEYRPYTSEELQKIVGQSLKSKGSPGIVRLAIATTALSSNKVDIELASSGIWDVKALLEEWTHMNGDPCGVMIYD